MKFTIKKNNEFSFLYRRGKNIVSPAVVTYYFKNKNGKSRYGITTGKKIGNAVKRNRARRIIREAYRELFPNIKKGYTFVFVARGKAPFLKSTDIKKQLLWQLRKEKLLENQE